MGMVSLLFSFRGRINRKQYWLGTSLVGFISFFGRMLMAALSIGPVDVKDPGAAFSAAAGAGLLALPLFALTVWCGLAIQFKRFHDRGRTGWISLAPLVLIVLLIASIIGDAAARAPLEQLFGDALPYFALLMLVSLAFFVDLGCLSGVDGPNKYGPPPGAPRPPMEPSGPSGVVDAASSLFGAQAAMDRAIQERGQAAQPQPTAFAPAPALAPAGAAPRTAPASFGRRASR